MRLGHETAQVADGLFTYVALDSNGRPRPIPA